MVNIISIPLRYIPSCSFLFPTTETNRKANERQIIIIIMQCKIKKKKETKMTTLKKYINQTLHVTDTEVIVIIIL